MSFKKIKLNYSELAFIMNISSKDSKDIFKDVLQAEKISIKEEIKVEVLKEYFGKTKSVDPRYDGLNCLEFNLKYKKDSFKKYLNDKAFIKKKKFTSGQSIFYKILEKKDLESIKNNLEYKHKYLFGNN